MRVSSVLLLSSVLPFAPVAVAHSQTRPSNTQRLVAVAATSILTQTRQTLRSAGFSLLRVDSANAVWALGQLAGSAIVRCQQMGSDATLQKPVLVVVTALDSSNGALVTVRVTGWRPGQMPNLGGMMSTSFDVSQGPCMTTGALEEELFRLFGAMARRAAQPN